MKFRPLFLLLIVFLFTNAAHAQVEDATMPPSEVPDQAPPPVDIAAPRQTMAAPGKAAAPARVAPPRPQKVDTVKGNAGRDVAIVEGKGSCANNLNPKSVVNRSTTRVAKVGIEVQVVFRGNMSKKIIIVDNLAPNENRAIGCDGCIENPTGQSCTTYKIVAAMFK